MRISPATGEHGLILVFRDDVGTCVLKGRPSLTFRDAGGLVVTLEIEKTNSYVEAIPPRSIRLTHGGRAFVLVAKYRCDLGDAQLATVAQVRLRHGRGRRNLDVRPVDIARCKGSPDGPGQSIAISPFVANTRQLQVTRPG